MTATEFESIDTPATEKLSGPGKNPVYIKKQLKSANRLKTELKGAENVAIGEQLWRICTDAIKAKTDSEQKQEAAEKQREQCMSELIGTREAKEKLERLCKALQAENRRIKEEARLMNKCIDEKQASMQQTVETVMTDFRKELTEMEEDRIKTENENKMLREKLHSLASNLSDENERVAKKDHLTINIIEEYKKNHEQSRNTMQKLSEERNTLLTLSQEQKRELDECFSKLEKMNDVFDKTSESLKKLKQDLSDSNREKVRAKQKLAKEIKQKNSLEDLCRSLQKRKRELTCQIHALKKDPT